MKLLTLTGVATYGTPAFNGVALLKGQTVMVADDVAEFLLQDKRYSDNDGLEIPIFTEAKEDAHYHYDFSASTMPVNANSPRPVARVELVDPTGDGVAAHLSGESGGDGSEDGQRRPAAKTTARRARS